MGSIEVCWQQNNLGQNDLLLLRAIAGGVFGVLHNLDLDDPGAVLGLRAHHRIEDRVNVLCDAFTGAVW